MNGAARRADRSRAARRRTPTLAPGAEVHVAIRPEDIEVRRRRRRAPGRHALPGVIDALLFVGDRYEARVTLGGEQRILLLLPRAREWRRASALQLAFPPELVSVWPA